MSFIGNGVEGQASAALSTGSRERYDREDIKAAVATLDDLDIHELRIRWRKRFRKSAPARLPRYLLFRILAYRIQADAYGDLDRETARYLDRVAKDYQRRRAAGESRSSKQPPPVPPVPDRRTLKLGTLLAREHDGVLHRVVVMQDGFLWNERTYKSLSEVARAITGTNWNGPRFFGLRDRKRVEHGDAGLAEVAS